MKFPQKNAYNCTCTLIPFRGKLEANRLELQWKKICDRERRSKERNRELLQDFERVEKHAAVLAVKSERLKSYKVPIVFALAFYRECWSVILDCSCAIAQFNKAQTHTL